MRELAAEKGVITGVGHMCQYGMQHIESDGKASDVLKPTRWMSTSACLLKRLTKKCPGDHEHTTLLGASKTKAAAIYPPELCRQLLLGVQDQFQLEAKALAEARCKSSCCLYNCACTTTTGGAT